MDIKIIDLAPLKITGLVLIIIGFTFFILALIHLGTSWRLGIDVKNPGKIVTTGIYSFSRHPIYMFFYLYFLGTFLINTNIIFFISFILMTIILHCQAIQEEKFLLGVFPKEYKEYSYRVDRYITVSRILEMKFVKTIFRLDKEY